MSDLSERRSRYSRYPDYRVQYAAQILGVSESFLATCLGAVNSNGLDNAGEMVYFQPELPYQGNHQFPGLIRDGVTGPHVDRNNVQSSFSLDMVLGRHLPDQVSLQPNIPSITLWCESMKDNTSLAGPFYSDLVSNEFPLQTEMEIAHESITSWNSSSSTLIEYENQSANTNRGEDLLNVLDTNSINTIMCPMHGFDPSISYDLPQASVSMTKYDSVDNFQNDDPVHAGENVVYGLSNFPLDYSGHSPCLMTPGSSSSGASSIDYKDFQYELLDLGNELDISDLLGPCSNTWEVPKRKSRRKKQDHQGNSERRQFASNLLPGEPRRRSAFKDQETRNSTAMTRKIRGCIRCRLLRIRCELDMNNQRGPCLTCQRAKRPKLYELPCIRSIITDASLYRQQDVPNQLFSRRWKSMELTDITDWASDKIKIIEISQIILDAPYRIEVRKFIPKEGDMLEETWPDGQGALQTYRTPLYAIADMKKTATILQEFVKENVYTYISEMTGQLDNLIGETYQKAYQHLQDAQTGEEEKKLLRDCFHLWVACRKISNPEHIYGSNQLGAYPVQDPSSPWSNRVPMPPIMISQMECIMYRTILQPLQKAVAENLHKIVLDSKRKYWLTIYLTMFILLHNCALFTRRNQEFARRMNMQKLFANSAAINALHNGAITMLAHFHYINGSCKPFTLAQDPQGLEELAENASLSQEQANFVAKTALLVSQKADIINYVRKTKEFGNDLYWISQLYDEDWKPGPTA